MSMDIEAFLRENILILYGVCLWIMVMLLLWNFSKYRGKVKVRVKTPLGEQVRWLKPEDDGKTIVMEKAGRKSLGWRFTFTNKSLVPQKRWYGGIYYAIDVFHKALEAVEYDFKDSVVSEPQLSEDDVVAINRLDAFKRRYGKVEKPMSSVAIWLLIIIGSITLVLVIMNMRGIRIG